jgi:hypothetical protein
MSVESFSIGGRRPPLQHAFKKRSAFGFTHGRLDIQ